MTAALDFATLPPGVNSAWIYPGADSATPHVAWMNTTAAQAEQTATRAEAAAGRVLAEPFWQRLERVGRGDF
jgi:PPE-repeat protein